MNKKTIEDIIHEIQSYKPEFSELSPPDMIRNDTWEYQIVQNPTTYWGDRFVYSIRSINIILRTKLNMLCIDVETIRPSLDRPSSPPLFRQNRIYQGYCDNIDTFIKIMTQTNLSKIIKTMDKQNLKDCIKLYDSVPDIRTISNPINFETVSQYYDRCKKEGLEEIMEELGDTVDDSIKQAIKTLHPYFSIYTLESVVGNIKRGVKK